MLVISGISVQSNECTVSLQQRIHTVLQIIQVVPCLKKKQTNTNLLNVLSSKIRS